VILKSDAKMVIETRNRMLEEAQAGFEQAGLGFGERAVANASFCGELNQRTGSLDWLKRFPMWD